MTNSKTFFTKGRKTLKLKNTEEEVEEVKVLKDVVKVEALDFAIVVAKDVK